MDIAKSGNRDGYQIYADDPVEGSVASYTEGETPGVACHRCFVQFPLEKGFTNHMIKNLSTGKQYRCAPKKQEEKPDGSLVQT